MELCLRRRLSGGRWTAVDKSSPDWRWLQAKWLSGHYRDTLSGTPTSSPLQHKPSGKSWIISRHNRIMFLYYIVVVPIPGGCGWCGCRDKISFCKQSKFVPAQCPHCPPHPAWSCGGQLQPIIYTGCHKKWAVSIPKYGKLFQEKIYTCLIVGSYLSIRPAFGKIKNGKNLQYLFTELRRIFKH